MTRPVLDVLNRFFATACLRLHQTREAAAFTFKGRAVGHVAFADIPLHRILAFQARLLLTNSRTDVSLEVLDRENRLKRPGLPSPSCRCSRIRRERRQIIRDF